jgi:hypothetical protein
MRDENNIGGLAASGALNMQPNNYVGHPMHSFGARSGAWCFVTWDVNNPHAYSMLRLPRSSPATTMKCQRG